MTYRTILKPVDLHFSAWDLRHLPWYLLVAPDAPAHRLIDHARDPVHLFDLAVAGLAGDLSAQMRQVIEIDIGRSGQAVDPLPRRFGALVSVLEHLLHFGAIGFHRAMAKSAFLHTRNEHIRRLAVAILVAEIAFDLALASVNPVAVLNRLHRSVGLAVSGEIKECTTGYEHYEDGDDELDAAQDCSCPF